MHDMITQSQKLTEYLTFVERKRHTVGDGGFRVNYVPEMAFDFQREIIERAVRKGRCAIFAEVFSPVSLDRKAIGIELKESYYKQMLLNLKDAPTRFANEGIAPALNFEMAEEMAA